MNFDERQLLQQPTALTTQTQSWESWCGVVTMTRSTPILALVAAVVVVLANHALLETNGQSDDGFKQQSKDFPSLPKPENARSEELKDLLTPNSLKARYVVVPNYR